MKDEEMEELLEIKKRIEQGAASTWDHKDVPWLVAEVMRLRKCKFDFMVRIQRQKRKIGGLEAIMRAAASLHPEVQSEDLKRALANVGGEE